MDQDEIKALAVKLAAFTDLLEQRGDEAVRQTAQAAQSMGHSVQQASAAAERLTTSAVAEFKRAAASLLADGLREPLEEAGQTMQAGTRNLQSATSALERQMQTLQKVHAANAWKAFVASATASIVVIAAATYIGIRTHQDMVRSEWVGLINAAIASGKLAPCVEGDGLCAKVKDRWMRLTP
jgi:hypothetical protein